MPDAYSDPDAGIERIREALDWREVPKFDALLARLSAAERGDCFCTPEPLDPACVSCHLDVALARLSAAEQERDAGKAHSKTLAKAVAKEHLRANAAEARAEAAEQALRDLLWLGRSKLARKETTS